MLGLPTRYLIKHPWAAVEPLKDPLQIWLYVRDVYLAERSDRESRCSYACDSQWEQRLHEALGLAWPCPMTREFEDLYNSVNVELQEQGIHTGPESFQWWNDGDAGLLRAIWCLVRHQKPKKLVETGVAHGLTSRVILEALERNSEGHLWSIDLPPLERHWRKQVGVAVHGPCAARWSYIKGTSSRRLPKLLAGIGEIDLFIHDSLHSAYNVRFEMDRALEFLGPGKPMVIDDIDSNNGFRTFTQAHSTYESLICEAEPLRPDLRRFNHKGLFGIILKQPPLATLGH
jgi:hypothetical protein